MHIKDKGLPRTDEDRTVPDFDWDAEYAVEVWNATLAMEEEITSKEHDIYLSNGGMTIEEAHIYAKNITSRSDKNVTDYK